MRAPRAAFLAAAAVVAAVGVLAVYGGVIDAALFYDDYHFVRPWTPVDLRRVWFGSWDPAGIEVAFYRPITAWLFAARFWLFALNGPAMHATSVVLHGTCALLVGWFLIRERAPRAVALFGVWVYAIYPLFPYAHVNWVTNQMHLAESLVVLATLIVWQRARSRGLTSWAPVVALAAVAFLIKEDAVMLLPALAALTWLHDRLVANDRSWRAWRVAAGAAACTLALIAFRADRLGRLGGYGTPDLSTARANLWKGMEAALFLWPTRGPWQGLAAAIAIAALACGVVVARRARGVRKPWLLGAAGVAVVVLGAHVPAISLPRANDYPLWMWQPLASAAAIIAITAGFGLATWRSDRQSLFLLCAGVVVVVSFNLPFGFVSKREQYHLLALGGVLIFAGAGQALWTTAATMKTRARAVAALLLLTAPLYFMARASAAEYQRCNPDFIAANRGVHGWWVTPDELKAFVTLEAARCRAGEPAPDLAELPIVTWGVYAEEHDSAGVGYRWTSDRVTSIVRHDAKTLSLALRRPDATPSAPVTVEVRADGVTGLVQLTSDAWQDATVTFHPGWLSWLRRGERVDLVIHEWFVPAVLDPKSADLRRLGAELRIVGVP